MSECWVKQWDPTEQAHYYWNSTTGEAVWDQPEGYTEGAKDEQLDAATKLQSLFRGKKARADVEAKQQALRMEEGQRNLWVQQWDPTEQAYYYYNTESGEAQWEKPADFKEGGTSEKVQAVLKLQCMFRARVARLKVSRQRLLGQPVTGIMRVAVNSAQFSEDLDFLGKMDPYVCMWIERAPSSTKGPRKPRGRTSAADSKEADVTGSTSTIQGGGKTPTWKDNASERGSLQLQLLDASINPEDDRRQVLWVEAWDDDAGDSNGDLIGQAMVELHHVLSLRQAPQPTTLQLWKKEKEDIIGFVQFEVQFEPQGGRLRPDTAGQESVVDKFANREFGELSLAEAAAVEGEWVKQYDPTEGKEYFWNTRTGESSWEQPEGFVEGGESANMAAALKIQSAFRGNKARGEVEAKRKELQMREGDADDDGDGQREVWVKQWDPTERAWYYYNSETYESQWEEPEGFKEGATHETVTAVLKIQCMWRARKARRRVAAVRDSVESKSQDAPGSEEKGDDKEQEEEDGSKLAEAAKSDAFGQLSYVETDAVTAKWIEQWDPTERGYYYWNTETGEAVWEKPDDFEEGGESQNMAAALKIQSAFRGNKTRKGVAERIARLKMKEQSKGQWVKQWDPTEGASYYYNTASGECQWEEPPGFVEGVTDETITAVLTIQCMFRAKLARRRIEEIRVASMPRVTGGLIVKVKRAQFDEDKDTFGMMDPYVVLWLEPASTGGPGRRQPRGPVLEAHQKSVKTAHSGTVNGGGRQPVWGPEAHPSELNVELDDEIVDGSHVGRTVMWVEAWDDDPGSGAGEFLGHGRVDLEDAVATGINAGGHGNPQPVAVRVHSRDGADVVGTVFVEMSFDVEAGEFVPMQPLVRYDAAERQAAEEDAELDGLLDALSLAAPQQSQSQSQAAPAAAPAPAPAVGYTSNYVPDTEPMDADTALEADLFSALAVHDEKLAGVAAAAGIETAVEKRQRLAAEEAARQQALADEAAAEAARQQEMRDMLLTDDERQMLRLNGAATKIQAAYRGHFHRENLKLIDGTPQVAKRKRKVRRRLAKLAGRQREVEPYRERLAHIEGRYVRLCGDEVGQQRAVKRKLDAAGDAIYEAQQLLVRVDEMIFAIRHKQVSGGLEALRGGVNDAENELVRASKVAVGGLEDMLLRTVMALKHIYSTDVYLQADAYFNRAGSAGSNSIAPGDAIAIKKGVDSAGAAAAELLGIDVEESKEKAIKKAVVKALRAQTDYYRARDKIHTIIDRVKRGAATAEDVLQQRERCLMRLEESYTREYLAEVERRRVMGEDREAFLGMCRRRWKLGRRLRRQLGEDMPVVNGGREQQQLKAARRVEMAAFKGGVKQMQLDATFNTPHEACVGGATVARMRRLLTEAESRLRLQEGRVLDINNPDPDSRQRLLHTAAWNGHKHLVHFLVKHGALVNQVDNTVNRQTALHYAARAGHDRVIVALLDEGAEAQLRDSSGDTALHWACRRGHYKAVKALLPRDLRDLEDEIAPEQLLAFAGDLGDMPAAWQAIATMNNRYRIAKEVCSTRPLARIMTEAEYALQMRRKLAGPLRSALDVGRSVPADQAPAALEDTRGSGEDWASDSGTARSVAGRRSHERRQRALQKSASSRLTGLGNSRQNSGTRSAASIGSRWVLKKK